MSETIQQLNDSTVYDVIAGIGNNEMKGLVFGVMRDESSYTALPLHTKTMALQGENPEWRLGVSTPFDYCETFAAVGAVAKSTTEPLKYTITELGRERALPLLGHLLDVSLTEEPPLLGFHGPTALRPNALVRQCQRRIEMMHYLRDVEGKTTSISTAAEALGHSASGANSLAIDLAKHDIIQYESSGRGKATITYTAEPGLTDIKFRSDAGQLMIDTVEVLKKHFNESTEPITNILIASKLIDDYGYTENRKELTRRISGKNDQLSQRQALKAHRVVDGHNARSAISATEEQLTSIDKLLRVVNGARKPSPTYLNEGREKLEVIMADYSKVNYLVSKARRESTGLKGHYDERQKNIKAVLAVLNTEHPLSLRDIEAEVLKNGLNLDYSTISSYAGHLAIQGRALQQQTREGLKYKLQND